MVDSEHRNIARHGLRRQTLNAAAAAAALGKRRSPLDIFRIIGLLTNKDPLTREGAIKNLTGIGGREAADAIARRLADGDPRVRAAACHALAEMRALRHKAQLYDALYDRDVPVRCAAAAALARMGDNYGLTAVVKLLKNPGPHARQALQTLNLITNRKFPLSQKGHAEALRWIKYHHKHLLKS